MPEVSIIMPNYNCAAFIGEAIESVLAQTYRDWELIICDDHSTDNSVAVIGKYTGSDPRIRLIHNNSAKGPGICRNQAISQAQGAYIAFLDSDDIWYPEKLQVQIEFMRSHSVSVDITYMAYDIMSENGRKIYAIIPPVFVDYKSLLKGKRIHTMTIAVKRSVPIHFPELLVAEDTAMWLRLFRSGYAAYGIQTPLSSYRLRSNSSSARKLRMAKAFWCLLRDQEKIGLMPRIYYFSCFCAHMFKKYIHILPYIFRLR